jgi:malate dehydrogenase (oxaloacetate-decarboxylating)
MARTSRIFDVVETANGREIVVFGDGTDVLRDPSLNKGTAFTVEERELFDIDGYFPPHVSTLEQQLDRTYASYTELGNDTPPVAAALHRYQFLRALQDRNETLFYAFLARYTEEVLPIVYTPTVGDAIKAFSRLFRTPRGVTFSPKNMPRADAILAHHPLPDVRMVVATDSSAILGIGDQGYGGIGICIGKLALYTVGGLAPYQALPASLDVGTDREDLRNDPLYLGLREPRLRGAPYFEMTDRFVDAIKKRFPRAIVQWEDLSKDTAFDVLARYRKVIPSFNDDVQGTGAVTLAGLLTAAKVRDVSITDDVYVIHGAGAGGAGVAWAIVEGLVKEGLSREDAHRRVLVIDSKGLLTEERAMEDYKKVFAQPKSVYSAWKTAGPIPTLHETIVHAKATVLLGLSGQHGAFDEAAISAVGKNTERPMVFPLSNPTVNCEALPEEVYRILGSRALVCTGSPFPPVTLADGEVRPIGQGNNSFIFPGLGFGACLVEAKEITDAMVLAASYALVEYTARHHLGSGLVYPPVRELRAVSFFVAAWVAKEALDSGVAGRSDLPHDLPSLEKLVAASAYEPVYLPIRRG